MTGPNPEITPARSEPAQAISAAGEAVCKHCGKPIVFAPYWRDARLPNPHVWFHPPGAKTCSTRPDGWPEDGWPHAEPVPETRDLAWFLDRIPDDMPADDAPLTAGEMGRQSIEAFIAARADRIPKETTVPEQIPGWEGAVGPFPSQYGEPHVYARDVHSGAGNCVCGAAPGHRRHVQIAPGVNVPDWMRS